MLRVYEENMKSNGKIILIVNNENLKKKNKRHYNHSGKGKGNEFTNPKPNTLSLKPGGGVAKEGIFFLCSKTEH